MFHIYVKQHTKTKKKYLGYTTRNNPFDYLGSGKYWTNHINKHGTEYVETIELHSFNTKQEAWEYAQILSEENDVALSSEWANLKPEGIDGGKIGEYGKKRSKKIWDSRKKNGTASVYGHIHNEETKKRMSEIKKEQYQNGLSPNITFKGKTHSEESRKKMRDAHKGRKYKTGWSFKRPESANKKLSETTTGRKRKYLPDGSWTWQYPLKG